MQCLGDGSKMRRDKVNKIPLVCAANAGGRETGCYTEWREDEKEKVDCF